MEPSDGEIIAGVLDGERQRFAVLVERHGGALLSWLARRVSGADEARELYQETWVRAYQGLARLEDPGRLRGWLLGIAAHVLGKRRRRRGTLRFEPLGAHEPTQAPAPAPIERAELFERVRDAVAGLPPRQREVFELRALAGLEHRDVAERLGIREDNARANYYQAVRKLRALLGDELT